MFLFIYNSTNLKDHIRCQKLLIRNKALIKSKQILVLNLNPSFKFDPKAQNLEKLVI